MTTRILAFLAIPLCLGAILTLGLTNSAFAGEFDDESTVINQQAARAKDLPQTVVVRINSTTGEASVLETSAPLAADASGVAAVNARASEFKKITAKSEFDQMGSAESWYAWYNYGSYYAPTYYYYGYQYRYQPCYSYSYYGYAYYWYRW